MTDLSPGAYYLSVPSDPVANLLFRRLVLTEAAQSKRLQAELIEACRRDLLFWVNAFAFQYNPRRLGDQVGPFIPWPYQVEGFRWMLDRVARQEDGVVEKSRDMGWSWKVLLLQTWMGLFHRWTKHFCMSRNFEAVDKPLDSDALFWKIDFVLGYLPDWMKQPYARQKGVFDFKRTKSGISAQATTKEAGSGGRSTTALIDELGKIPDGHVVVADTADTADCRFFVSTHTGPGTAFDNLCRRAEKGLVRRFVSHWSSHPYKAPGLYRSDPGIADHDRPLDKTFEYPADFDFVRDGTPTGGPFPGLRSPWYDAECVRRETDRAVKLNLDIDVAGAAKQFYDPPLVRRLVADCRPADWQGDLYFDRDACEPIELVPRADGLLRLWFRPGLGRDGRLNLVPPHRYTAGADASAGSGATPSTFTIFNADTREKWAEFADAWLKPDQFARYAVALCRLFKDRAGNPAFLTHEIPGVGSTFGQTAIREAGFRNMYFNTQEFRGERKESDTPGWNSQPGQNRLYAHELYRSALGSGDFVNYSEAALKETLDFIYEKGSVENPKAKKTEDPSGATLNHSDRVIADMLAYFGAKVKGWVGGEKAGELAREPLDVYSIAGRRQYRERLAYDEELEPWL